VGLAHTEDNAGAITDSYECDAFGNEINHTGTTPNNYLYRGEQWDPDLGLYYLRARYMNPLTGRFMGVDPLADEGQPRYEYAGADPVDGMDPNGDEDLVEYRPLIPGRLPVSFPLDFPGWCETASGDALGSYLPGCSAPGGNNPGGPAPPPGSPGNPTGPPTPDNVQSGQS